MVLQGGAQRSCACSQPIDPEPAWSVSITVHRRCHAQSVVAVSSIKLRPKEWLFLPFSCLPTEQQTRLQSTLKLRLDGPAWRNAANTSTQSEEVRSCCIML